MLEVLGKGAFGEVYKGLLAEIPGTPGYLVAVKSLHPSLNADRTSLLTEAAITAQFNSPFIVGLVGVITVDDPLLVVLEFCEHGALNRYVKVFDLDQMRLYRLSADCAEGLQYLSDRGFIHRDVAARNVLISSDHRAKISDFGMSREAANSDYYRSKGGQV
jgi:serine/threonine protein kinase